MNSCQTLIVNLFAGPGTGKSTTMAGIFSELKFRGINCEMAPEFAKEKVWEESFGILSNQIYVFGKQLHAIHRVLGKVDVVITDSPLLMSLYYGKKECDAFKELVLQKHNEMNTYNIFLIRKKKYNPSGRMQTEKEAKKIDGKLLKILADNDISHSKFASSRESIQVICTQIIDRIGNHITKYT